MLGDGYVAMVAISLSCNLIVVLGRSSRCREVVTTGSPSAAAGLVTGPAAGLAAAGLSTAGSAAAGSAAAGLAAAGLAAAAALNRIVMGA